MIDMVSFDFLLIYTHLSCSSLATANLSRGTRNLRPQLEKSVMNYQDKTLETRSVI